MEKNVAGCPARGSWLVMFRPRERPAVKGWNCLVLGRARADGGKKGFALRSPSTEFFLLSRTCRPRSIATLNVFRRSGSVVRSPPGQLERWADAAKRDRRPERELRVEINLFHRPAYCRRLGSLGGRSAVMSSS